MTSNSKPEPRKRRKPEESIGERFGKLVVCKIIGVDKRGFTLVLAKCDCGNTTERRLNALRTGNTKSCGCFGVENVKLPRRHGLCGTKEYIAWKGMRNRCNNEGATGYENYGGRGIRVCERWDEFVLFLKDVGPSPSRHHTIDRWPNQDGNYEPGNVRWALTQAQNQNRRSTKLNPELVAKIRELYAQGKTPSVITATLGVSRSQVGGVLYGGKWKA